MSPLAARKRLLIAESEINRLLLARDLRKVGEEVSLLTDQAKHLATLVALGVAATSLLFRRKRSDSDRPKSSWLSAAFKALRMGWEFLARSGARQRRISPRKPQASLTFELAWELYAPAGCSAPKWPQQRASSMTWPIMASSTSRRGAPGASASLVSSAKSRKQ